MGVAKVEGPEVILIMDVEGTDGRERGEEHVAFERKTSLFSLTVASVLIINMWMQDIGRYNAANIGLLKTVFELNLQLFQRSSSSKTLILFVIRDHVLTPLSKLQATILTDMDNVWQSLSKPAQYEDSKVTNFFDFAFATLAHKELAAEQFVQQALGLRERFTNPQHPDFLLKPEYNKGIPADGLATYAYNVWDTIKANRDLDIPTQKEMLATYRCEEIMQSALDGFQSEFQPIRERIERGEVVEHYGAKAQRFIDNASNAYNNIASRYQPDVSARKYATLRQRMLAELEAGFERLVERLRAKAFDFFRTLVHESFAEGQSAAAVLQFNTTIEGITTQTLKNFEEDVRDAVLPDAELAAAAGWKWDAPLQELQTTIAGEVERLKKEQVAHLTAEAKANLERTLTSPISILLEGNGSVASTWLDIRTALDKAVSGAEAELRAPLTSLALPDDQVRRHLDALRAQGPAVVKKCVRDAGAHLALMMQKRFDEAFNFDENRLPRRWSRRDDVAALFKEARTQAEGLVELFAVLRLSADDDALACMGPDGRPTDLSDGDARVVMPYKERNAVLERFRESTNASFKSAMQEQEAARAQGMHPFILILILILGWNELMAILSWVLGPLLLPLLAMVGAAGYLIYAGKLGGPAVQIAQTMGMAMARQVWGQAQALLDSLTNRPAPAPVHQKAD